MKEKDLIECEAQLVALATELFDYITGLPEEIRPDDKKRTGIQIYLREVGTRNSVFASIHQPSKQAQSFSVEKAVRSEILGDFSSQNSEDPDKMKFRGSFSILFRGSLFQSSTSGLTGDEDSVVSLRNLSLFTNLPLDFIFEHVIMNRGEVPECFFDKSHYLYDLVHK